MKKKKFNFKKLIPYLIRIVCSSILISYLLYLAVTEGNEAITKLLISIKENNLEVKFIEIFFPIILIVCTMIELGTYIMTSSNKKDKENEVKKKTNKVKFSK